jgi:hypothetical protein
MKAKKILIAVFLVTIFVGTCFSASAAIEKSIPSKSSNSSIIYGTCPVSAGLTMAGFVLEKTSRRSFLPIKDATLTLSDENGIIYKVVKTGFLGYFNFGNTDRLVKEHNGEWWTIKVDAAGYQSYLGSWKIGWGWKVIKLEPEHN